jgi:hypothetical protein
MSCNLLRHAACSSMAVQSSVVDPDHFDLDPTFHFDDAAPDPDLSVGS